MPTFNQMFEFYLPVDAVEICWSVGSGDIAAALVSGQLFLIHWGKNDALFGVLITGYFLHDAGSRCRRFPLLFVCFG